MPKNKFLNKKRAKPFKEVKEEIVKQINKNSNEYLTLNKNEYDIDCQEFYDNKNKQFYQVRSSFILKYNDKIIIFIHLYNKIVLYEIKQDSFIYLKEYLAKDKLGNNTIDKFFIVKNKYDNSHQNIINLCFVCSREVIICKLDIENYDNFLLCSKLKVENDSFRICSFKKMVSENMMIFNSSNDLNIITLFPKLKLEFISLGNSKNNSLCNVINLKVNDIIGICREKDIIIYDIKNKNILWTFIIPQDMQTYEMGIRKFKSEKQNNSLFIFYSEKGIYLLDYKNKKIFNKLSIGNQIKSKIRKIKQLNGDNIAILYNYFNLAIYNIEKDAIIYNFKSDWKKSPGNEDFPILHKFSNDILLYGSDPYTVNILNYSKGDILGYIRDKKNKKTCIDCKGIKIYEKNLKKNLNEKIEYSFIKNSKTTLIVKYSKKANII